MTTLTLITGKRNSNSGRLERLRGIFSSDVPGKQYTEVFVTDCKKTVKINGRIYPGAHQVFSYVQPDLAEANSQLDLSGDLYVYVKARGQKDECSNAYKIPKEGSCEDAGDLQALKRDNIADLMKELSSINKEIFGLNAMANLSSGYLPFEISSEINDWITDRMAELARKREQIENDLKEKKRNFERMFGPKKMRK